MNKITFFALLALVGFVVADLPVFPNDWTATEADSAVIFQGQYSVSGDNYCCSDQSNCEVQSQFQEGKNYFDYSHNRTRFDQFGSDQSIVSFYDLQKECLVQNNTCQEYCPMDGDELSPGFLDPNATDEGSRDCGSFNGACELYEWNQTILGIVVMETSDVLVNITDFNNPIPLEEIDQLTPFGQYIGTATSKWNDFTPGTPDPSLFDVQGVLGCPLSQNCNSSARRMHRIRNRAWRTFLKYANEAAAARRPVPRDPRFIRSRN